MYLVLRRIYKVHKLHQRYILDMSLVEFILHQRYILDMSLVEFMYLVGAILHPLVEFMYLVFTGMPASYRRQLRSVLLYSCYVFLVLINSLVC